MYGRFGLSDQAVHVDAYSKSSYSTNVMTFGLNTEHYIMKLDMSNLTTVEDS